MLRASKRKGSLQVMLMALVVLVIGITAPGYGDDDHGDGKNLNIENYLRLSDPALEGPLTLWTIASTVTSQFAGTCFFTPQSISDATLARLMTKGLVGFALPVLGDQTQFFPSGCLRKDQTAGDTIVLIVTHVTGSIKPSTCGTPPVICSITAEVVLNQVVPRLHKDKDK